MAKIQPIVPPRLAPGDEIRVLALSRSLGGIIQQAGVSEADIDFACGQLRSLGLKVTFGRHARECNEHLTAPIDGRLADFHEAWADPAVRGVLAVSGGVGAVQLVEGLDYALVARHSKVLCGYSDIAWLCNAIVARTGLVTYYGPNFSTFMPRAGGEYTLEGFRACLFSESPLQLQPAERWSDDPWSGEEKARTFLPNEGPWAIQEGEAGGTVVGGSAFILNMLQGSGYFPALEGSILFVESPSEGKATRMALDTALRALAFQPQFGGVRGVVIGRYARNAGVDAPSLARVIQEIPAMAGIPVAANVDFGHTSPMATIPIGGTCALSVSGGRVAITFTSH